LLPLCADAAFREAWMYRPVHFELRPARTVAILRALEVASRGAKHEPQPVPSIEQLSVEHVLPQGWAWSGHYPLPEESEATATRNRLLHTFGNLTLLTKSLNSAVSNGPFADVEGDDGMRKDGKRTMICRYSLLSMNSYFQALKSDVWGEMQIVERSETLLAQALEVWSRD
jgi:hypothetical protein